MSVNELRPCEVVGSDLLFVSGCPPRTQVPFFNVQSGLGRLREKLTINKCNQNKSNSIRPSRLPPCTPKSWYWILLYLTWGYSHPIGWEPCVKGVGNLCFYRFLGSGHHLTYQHPRSRRWRISTRCQGAASWFPILLRTSCTINLLLRNCTAQVSFVSFNLAWILGARGWWGMFGIIKQIWYSCGVANMIVYPSWALSPKGVARKWQCSLGVDNRVGNPTGISYLYIGHTLVPFLHVQSGFSPLGEKLTIYKLQSKQI